MPTVHHTNHVVLAVLHYNCQALYFILLVDWQFGHQSRFDYKFHLRNSQHHFSQWPIWFWFFSFIRFVQYFTRSVTHSIKSTGAAIFHFNFFFVCEMQFFSGFVSDTLNVSVDACNWVEKRIQFNLTRESKVWHKMTKSERNIYWVHSLCVPTVLEWRWHNFTWIEISGSKSSTQAMQKMCHTDRKFIWKGIWTQTRSGILAMNWVTRQNCFNFFWSDWPTINWRNRSSIIWLHWVRLLAFEFSCPLCSNFVNRCSAHQILYNLIGGKCTPMTWYFR